MRPLFVAETDWQFLVLTPAAPWADRLFPAAEYPRDRFRFVLPAETSSVVQPEKLQLLVTTTTGLDPLDAPLLDFSRTHGVPTLTFVESWDNVWKMERVARELGKSGQRVVLPDHLLVWNDIMKTHALRAFPELTRGQITVTGAPRLDFFGPRYVSRVPSREETFRALGAPPAARLLHLATTELYDHGHVAKAIARAKRRGDLPADLFLYASVHPGGKMERHRPWAEAFGFTVRFSPGRTEDASHPDFRYQPTEEDLLLLVATFRHTDVMVNLSSTVALESCLADRPTVCAVFGKRFDWWNWRRSMVVRDFKEHYADLVRGGGITVAQNPQELVAALRAYLADPSKNHEGRRRSAEIIATTLAGDASARVLDVLQRIVAEHQEPAKP